MSFKENLLRKIEIDGLAAKVAQSLKPQSDVPKIDKDAMKRLLDFAGYTYQRQRDLDLYTPNAPDDPRVLVLDNDLAVYRTTLEDVILRKSPYVKEMISIRNVIKILNDADVIVSKKTDSVFTVQQEALATLDLSFTGKDLEEIEYDGKASLEMKQAEGVRQSLALFAEILDYRPLPKAMTLRGYLVLAGETRWADGSVQRGPLVVYNDQDSSLKYAEEMFNVTDPASRELVRQITLGKRKAAHEGPEVFRLLREAAQARGRMPDAPEQPNE